MKNGMRELDQPALCTNCDKPLISDVDLARIEMGLTTHLDCSEPIKSDPARDKDLEVLAQKKIDKAQKQIDKEKQETARQNKIIEAINSTLIVVAEIGFDWYEEGMPIDEVRARLPKELVDTTTANTREAMKNF